MPQLIRTPEQVLRETKRDLYFIEFHQWNPCGPSDQEIPGKADIVSWFELNLPHVTLEQLGSRENSGFIIGGIGRYLRVDFDDASLDLFADVWENPDGTSKDGRWSCYQWSSKEFVANEEVEV